jgi:hypothetical protein
MGIKIAVSGPFLDVLVTDTLEQRDLPPLLDAIEAARQKGPFVLLTDTLSMKSAPRQIITEFATALKRLPPMKNLWLGDAVVTGSPVTRFILSSLIMVAPLPTEVQVFEKRDPAERWCGFLLTRAGVPLPGQLKRFA